MKPFNHFFAKITLSLTLILCLFAFTTCDNGGNEEDNEFIIWDIAPVVADIMITNQTGVNLLNPAAPGSLFGKNISIVYKGETYDAQWEKNNSTREYLAKFHGLILRDGYTIAGDKIMPEPSKNFLIFGEFDGATNQDISLVLKIEDCPEEYHIDLTNRITWKKHNPIIDRSIKVNGKTIPYGMITITLP